MNRRLISWSNVKSWWVKAKHPLVGCWKANHCTYENMSFVKNIGNLITFQEVYWLVSSCLIKTLPYFSSISIQQNHVCMAIGNVRVSTIFSKGNNLYVSTEWKVPTELIKNLQRRFCFEKTTGLIRVGVTTTWVFWNKQLPYWNRSV